MKTRSIDCALLLVALAALAPAGAAHAQWNTCGVALATTPVDQFLPAVASDNAGGAITAWADHRNPRNPLRWVIYAQRVNALGVVQWAANGVPVAPDTATADTVDQHDPAILADGSGGAFVVWVDGREYPYSDIYLQHINGSGTPLWNTSGGGVGVCRAVNVQQHPVLVTDGAGGVIVLWQDCRNGANFDIYARRVDATGTPQWTTDGVALCLAADSQLRPEAIPDGAGGAIVTWYDYRSVVSLGGDADVYAQRVNASGTPLWAADGVLLHNSTYGDQVLPNIISDGAGGAIVVWQDSYSGNYDIRAQRVSPAGDLLWDSSNGAVVCNAPNGQFNPVLCTDGAGGAIVAWHDMRKGGNSDADVYAQRLDASGVPQWPADGDSVCTDSTGHQQYPSIVTDAAGGAIVVWYDARNFAPSLYAQRLNGAGATLWAANGVNICGVPYGQYAHDAIADGAGGEIVAWQDGRANNGDIYLARADAGGALGAPSSQLGVGDGRAGGALRVATRPNPTARAMAVSFVLPAAAPAALELIDVTGRVVERLDVGSLGPGAHTVQLGRGARLEAGLYFVRLEQAGRSGLTRASVVP